MYVKSTDEYIHDIEDVYASLDRHLGVEYTDTVKAILATVLERDTAFDEIEELCNDILDYMDESRRLPRDKLLKKITEIKRTAYSAH